MSTNLPAGPLPGDQRHLLVTAARRFYLEDKSKVEIADEFGISRFKVARLLEQAREVGIVTITLNDEGIADPHLSQRVCEHLGLTEAVIVEASGDEAAVRHHVGEAAAQFLGRILVPDDVLGLAWGRTLSAMTESMPALPNVAVVQLTGAIGTNLDDSPVEIVRKVALSSGGSAHPIFAPLLVEDAATAAALRRQPDVAKALSLFDKVTTAVVSVGSWDPPISQLLPALSAEEGGSLKAQGVCADVAANLITTDGEVLRTSVSERTIAVSPEQLRAVPRVVAVAGGAAKADAVAAAARAGLITTLVADRALAEHVLETPPVPKDRTDDHGRRRKEVQP